MNPEGCIADWYGGARRLYGYRSENIVGHTLSDLYSSETRPSEVGKLASQLARAFGEGHAVADTWHGHKDKSTFRANVVVASLRDEQNTLHGYAVIVRNLNDRPPLPEVKKSFDFGSEPEAVGVVHGEFDNISEANPAFLGMLGYAREEMLEGSLNWFDLSDPEFAMLDEWSYEQCLRFGACTPIEKHLIRKDGSKILVRITRASVGIRPFRWVAFVQQQEVDSIHEGAGAKGVQTAAHFEEMVGSSAAWNHVLQLIDVVAPTDATVLILGETGTGKELIARALHRLSPRKRFPFVTLNCAAIPTGLLESELFGYERGAFTGALSQKIGRFEMAHGGTLFLDEIGDIPLDLQPKLLRALQEKSFERLGGTKTIPINVRLVAATNRNLSQMMSEKLFRSDLYYRLQVFPISTPPLRDRPEDIPALARHFTRQYSARMGRHVEKIPDETMKALVAWQWPGNIRELENFIERSVILSPAATLRAPLSEISGQAQTMGGSSTLEQVERAHILKILRESNGVITTAATRLGLHRTTLNAMMRKLGITRRDI
ncbi:hypothetical protein F183_A29010 [Bryobacterales bacterium F-183]|nr:hypothetical protein F183_A29010 [Bryobacterales bacterium F-183]